MIRQGNLISIRKGYNADPPPDWLATSVPPQSDAHLMPGDELVESHRLNISIALLSKKVDILIPATQMD